MSNSELYRFAHLLLKSHRPANLANVAPPTEEDLSALIDGQLSFTRKQEVYAFLNADKQLFDAWIALVEAKESVSVEQSSSESNFSKVRAYMHNLASFKWMIPTSIAASFVAIFLTVQMTTDMFGDSQDEFRFGKPNQTVNDSERGMFLLKEYVGAKFTFCQEHDFSKQQVAQYKTQIVMLLENILLNDEEPPALLKDLTEFTNIDSSDSLCSFNERLLKQLEDQ